MMSPRSLVRVGLVSVAAVLSTLAVLLLALRILASQADALTPRLEALLEARIGVPVHIDRLALSLERNDLHVELEGLRSQTPADEALVEVDRLSLRLDVWESLRRFKLRWVT